MRSARSPRTATARCSSSARPARDAPRRSRGGSRRSPARGTRPEHVLVLTRSRAARARLRERAEALLDRPHEELWIHTYEEAGRGAAARVRARGRPRPVLHHRRPRRPARDPARPARRAAAAPPRDPRQPGRPAGAAAAPRRPAQGRGGRAGRAARVGGRARSAPPRPRPSASGPSARSSSPISTRATTASCARPAASTAATWCSSSAACSATAPTSPRRWPSASATCSPTSSRTPGSRTARCSRRSPRTATWSAPATRLRRPAASAAPARRRWRPSGRPIRAPPRSTSGSRFAGPGVTRFWRCANERAQAQAVAREIEHLLAAGEVRPERICVIAGSGWREGRLAAAALEERSVPFRFAGDAAFFGRPEVRDVLAWLRMLADPGDAAAVVRTLTRPPAGLRSVDLAKVTTIARRRKLDMISALEAALESPQLPPEARDRIQSFLRLHRAASNALEGMRADVFVRRLIERVGLRRHRLFAASPETAERLVNLSRLAELAADWSRREPRGSVRDFVRHLTAVAEAGELGGDDFDRPAAGRGARRGARSGEGARVRPRLPARAAERARSPRAQWEDGWIPDELVAEPLPEPGDALTAERRLMLAHVAITRARLALVLSWPERADEGQTAPSRIYRAALEGAGAEEEYHEEELFGPAEGLHSTYRMLRDEVLEASWKAGSAISEMRLDTADDVNAAVARYLELVKLAALIQSPGAEPTPEAIDAINELLGRVASPEQRIGDRGLGAGRVRDRRGARARRPPRPGRRPARAVAGAVPAAAQRRPGALGLRHRPLPDLPAEVQVRPRLRDPAGADDQPALRDPHPPGARALPRRGAARQARRRRADLASPPAASIGCWTCSRPAGGARASAPPTTSSSTATARVAALARYHERHTRSESQPVWLERNFSFAIGPHQLRGRVDRVDQLPGRRLRGDRLQDRRPGVGAEAQRRRAARPLPARGARGVADRGRPRQLLVRARRRAGLARRPSPTTPSGSSARCSRSRRGSPTRTSSPGRRTRSAPGATTG